MFPGSCYSWQPQPLSQGHRSQALHSYRGMKGENNWRNCFFFLFFFWGTENAFFPAALCHLTRASPTMCGHQAAHQGPPLPALLCSFRNIAGFSPELHLPPAPNLCLLCSESPVLPELPHGLSASPILHRNRISLKALKLGAFPSTCFQKIQVCMC